MSEQTELFKPRQRPDLFRDPIDAVCKVVPEAEIRVTICDVNNVAGVQIVEPIGNTVEIEEDNGDYKGLHTAMDRAWLAAYWTLWDAGRITEPAHHEEDE